MNYYEITWLFECKLWNWAVLKSWNGHGSTEKCNSNKNKIPPSKAWCEVLAQGSPPSLAQQQLPIQSTPVIKLCENCWVVKRGANSSRNNDYLQRKVEISGRFCLLTFQSVEQTVLLFLFLAATPVTQLASRLDLQAGGQLLTWSARGGRHRAPASSVGF